MGNNPTTTTAIPPLTVTQTTENTAPNTQHIHEKAYYRGYRDFSHGRLDCPYHKDSLVAKEWQRGQNAAYFRNRNHAYRSPQFFKGYRAKYDGHDKSFNPYDVASKEARNWLFGFTAAKLSMDMIS